MVRNWMSVGFLTGAGMTTAMRTFYESGPTVAPLTRTKIPAVVVQMSPFTGEEGAAPWGIRRLDTPVVPAGVIRAVVDEAVAAPTASEPSPRIISFDVPLFVTSINFSVAAIVASAPALTLPPSRRGTGPRLSGKP